jgi:hypothetical protein
MKSNVVTKHLVLVMKHTGANRNQLCNQLVIKIVYVTRTARRMDNIMFLQNHH